MSDERIAVFTRRELENVVPAGPPMEFNGVRLRRSEAAATLTAEALEAVSMRICVFCQSLLTKLDHWYDDTLLVCNECGYWVGRGTRIGGPAGNRVVRGVVDFIDLDEATLDQLLLQISTIPERLRELDPFRAEKVMADLLAESMGCEVRAVGGRRDGGVDGYILAGDDIKSMIQVKWRQTGDRGESVSVVREVAGTMLARGVPSALIVTTRNHMSKPARDEMKLIGEREVVGLGRLSIDALVCQDILDMLELAWMRRGGDYEAVIPWLRPSTSDADEEPNRDWVFDYSTAV